MADKLMYIPNDKLYNCYLEILSLLLKLQDKLLLPLPQPVLPFLLLLCDDPVQVCLAGGDHLLSQLLQPATHLLLVLVYK